MPRTNTLPEETGVCANRILPPSQTPASAGKFLAGCAKLVVRGGLRGAPGPQFGGRKAIVTPSWLVTPPVSMRMGAASPGTAPRGMVTFN